MADRPVILVVDDTPENLTLMSGLLRDLYTVRLANGGARALRMAAEHPPDLILLDVMMPEVDGHEVCRRLKDDDRTRDIPILFLTAMSRVEDEALGLSLGAVDYITGVPGRPRPACPATSTARGNVRRPLCQRGGEPEPRDQRRRP